MDIKYVEGYLDALTDVGGLEYTSVKGMSQLAYKDKQGKVFMLSGSGISFLDKDGKVTTCVYYDVLSGMGINELGGLSLFKQMTTTVEVEIEV